MSCLGGPMFFSPNKITIVLFGVLIFSSAVNATEAIGYYSSGKIKNSESIIERGTPIHKLFLQRQRFFGTQQIQDLISDAADSPPKSI